MSFHLAKGIDITPNGLITPGSLQDYRVLRQQPWFPSVLASCSHLRLWVDWPNLQPSPDFAPGDPKGPNYLKFAGFDEQIRLAKSDGLKVILMPYRYPRWLNGTAGLGGEAALLFEPQDRVRENTWFSWYERRNRVPPPDPPGMKAFEYRLPADGHTPDSRWGGYVAMIFERWILPGLADYIEVVNEPNGQLWPLRGPSANAGDIHGRFDVEGSEMTVHKAVAEMITTVEHYRRHYGSSVTCLAPGVSDSGTQAPRLVSIAVDTPYGRTEDPFVPRLLAELDRTGFKGGPHWIWSYHNYGDQERATDRVQYLRRVLREGGWPGLHRDGGPALFATEGGVRLSVMSSLYRAALGRTPTRAEQLALQAAHMERAFHMHRRNTGNGAGVMLFTQYTLTADTNFDTALREFGGQFRPSFDTWCGLKTFDPRDPLPREWRPDDESAIFPGGDGRLDPLPSWLPA
jgi:hypothetical protein